jgi:hypothetical protein
VASLFGAGGKPFRRRWQARFGAGGKRASARRRTPFGAGGERPSAPAAERGSAAALRADRAQPGT